MNTDLQMHYKSLYRSRPPDSEPLDEFKTKKAPQETDQMLALLICCDLAKLPHTAQHL